MMKTCYEKCNAFYYTVIIKTVLTTDLWPCISMLMGANMCHIIAIAQANIREENYTKPCHQFKLDIKLIQTLCIDRKHMINFFEIPWLKHTVHLLQDAFWQKYSCLKILVLIWIAYAVDKVDRCLNTKTLLSVLKLKLILILTFNHHQTKYTFVDIRWFTIKKKEKKRRQFGLWG